jgi:L-ascorbate metabolism protein UlaG (beta-lactamase superfamily)
VTTSGSDVQRITWIGHSTVLLELDGVRLLTDPVFRSRVAHLRRVTGEAPDIPTNLDAALVSHVHYDHLDTRSLARVGRSLHVVVPRGTSNILRRRGFGHVREVDVGDEIGVGRVAIQVTQAEHEGRRGPFSPNAPSVGYLVKGSSRVYFAGDTDLFDGMSALAAHLDVALLPVAGWGSRVPAGHLDPLRAAQSLTLLRPRLAVPIHWGTYRRIGLPRDGGLLRAPAESFVRLANELAPNVDVRVLPVGGWLELGSAVSEPRAGARA